MFNILGSRSSRAFDAISCAIARHFNSNPPEIGEETTLPDEDGIIAKIVAATLAEIEQRDPDDQRRRGQHVKAHGVVVGSLRIEPDLPDALKVGLFSIPAEYPAWIRFSAANPKEVKDAARAIQGVAIKLMQVPGKKILEHESGTQDFLMISGETFPAADVKEVLETMLVLAKESPLALAAYFFNPLDFKWRSILALVSSTRFYSSPLDIRYWSTLPYKFGDGAAVKYSLRPSSGNATRIPKKKTANYIKRAMRKQLVNNDYQFDLMVQLQRDPICMPIETANKRWSEHLSPFQKVATLCIPSQLFDLEKRKEFGEKLSFNPWHSLPAHRPLGSISRARKAVYQAGFDFRRTDSDNRPHEEPSPGTVIPVPKP